jgi:hypothetical protein
MNRYVLPANNPMGKRVWTSGGEDSRAMPNKIRPLTHNMEMKVVISLIEELRSKLALDLDTAPSFDRSLGNRVSYETSFDSKQLKLEPRLVSTLSETRCLFRLFRFYIETASFGVSIEPKQNRNNRKK